MSKIVKKMKIMQQDGTFTDYVSIGAEAENINVDGESVETKLGKKPYYYNIVADMKADTKLKAGDMAATLGYYSINDGGAGKYVVVNEDNLIADDGIVYELNNGLYAKLILKDKINLMQIGCYGDGIHDDTNNIKKGILIASNLALPLYSPKKTYLLSDNIEINNIDLYLSECTFKNDNTFTIKGSGMILNLPKYRAISSLSDNVGIDIFECNNCQIFVPFIGQFKKGLQFSADSHGCCYHTVTIQEIYNCLTSIMFNLTDTGWINENTFIGGRLWNSTDFINSYGSSIIKIYLKGTSTHNIDNNYFLRQSVEGQEGGQGGIKIKLDYCQYITFDNLRYEGDSAKIDITNSSKIYMNSGFKLNGVSYLNQKPCISIAGQYNEVNILSSIGTVYNDVQMNSNAYASLQTRRTDATIANKITAQGMFALNNSGNDAWKFSNTGLEYYNDGAYKRTFSASGKWSFIPNADFTNGGLCLNTGTSISGGCFLWVNNGHLYGKIGQPSNATDGTIIL